MKRFTATEKWDDPWFWDLSPTAKILWIFLCDHCDAAGIIEFSFKLASAKIGTAINEKHLAELESRLHRLPCGKYAILGFIRFQFGNLSRDCKPHMPIFASLEKHEVNLEELERVCKGYAKGIHTLQEKEKEKEKEPEGGTGGRFSPPTMEHVKFQGTKIGLPDSECEKFWNFYESKGWKVGKSTMKSLAGAMAGWRTRWQERGGFVPNGRQTPPDSEPPAGTEAHKAWVRSQVHG